MKSITFVDIFLIIFIVTAFIIFATKIQNNTTTKLSDSEILNSRLMVINYDTRIENVKKYIFECTSKTTSLRDCTILAYDLNGFKRNNTFGEEDQINIEEIDLYNDNLKKSKYPLTTEMK